MIDARPLTARPSGVGNYIGGLLRGMRSVAAGDEFILCHHEPRGIAEGCAPANAEILRSPFSHESHPWGDVWRDVFLPRRLRRLGVELFHGPAFALPHDHRDFASVVTIHDLVAFRHAETMPRGFAVYLRAQIRAALRRADRVIVPTAAVRDEIAEMAPDAAARVRVVPHGVEPRFAAPAPLIPPDSPTCEPEAPHEDAGSPHAILARHGIRRPFVLCLGNVEPRKNLVRAIQAFGLARTLTGRRDDLAVSLVVCGERGPRAGAIFAEAERIPAVERPLFAGYVSDAEMPAILASAAVLLFPSLYEGFGLPILEAMACGVPVVTSDRGAMREVAGGAALLVDPLDVDAIAGALARALADADLAARLAALGRERAARFTWEQTAQATRAVYREAVGSA